MPKKRKPPACPTVTFLGAARTVTGSMHLLECNGQSILFDCGLFQGHRAEAYARNLTFPFRAKDIDTVLLSHAHIDHCGNLPNLVKNGFIGTIWCTPATRALVAVMLGDAAKIHVEDANYLNKKRQKGEPKIEPLYEGVHVYRTLLRLKAVPYDTPVSVGRGVEATFSEAGHLLGSAMVHVRIDSPEGKRTLTFTGDVGRPGLPILRDPGPVPPAHLLISESTYGGHTHEPVVETAERLGELVRRTVERRAKLVIPAFAVGRTQTIVYFLHQLMSAGRLPDVPIFVDSPMSVRATEVYNSHPECFDVETLAMLRQYPDLFGESRIRYVEKQHDSVALNSHPGPCVIISASGMCEGGRVLHHLKQVIEDERSTILIVGYQAPSTLGRRLVEKQPEVRILGRLFKLKAEVIVLNGLSSHADQPDMLNFLRPLVGVTERIRLVHGEADRAEKLAAALGDIGFPDVAVPERGGSVVV